MRRALPVATALVVLVTAACSSGSGATSPTGQGVATSPPASATGPPVSELVGRWEQARHCQDLVGALDQLGLGATAPAAVGDFFPDQTPQQLAKKPDVCAGAKPSPHSHFFTASGEFGSLDENLNQVDNGHYTVSGHTLKIGDASFRYSITGGDTLSLDPMITPAERTKALANPLEFQTATWMVAVSYPGTTWKRVPCESWC